MDLSGKSVLVVCGGYRYYGAEAATLSLMKVLGRAGARVECLCSDWSDGEFAAALAAEGIRYRTARMGWFYLRHPYWTMATLARLPGAWRRFRAALNESQPDYVFHSSYRTLALFYPWLRRNNVLYVHDKLSEDHQAVRIIPHVDGKVIRYLACSEFVAGDLRRMGLAPEKVATLRNFTRLQGSRTKRESSGPLRIGIVGQVVPKKGHATLLDALGALRRRGRRFRLAIFGTGPEAFMRRLRTTSRDLAIEESVEFRGFVRDKDAIYAELDLVVVPTLTEEPFGLAALEPAAFGIPVIASAKGGLPEVVEDGKSGFLFPAGDAGRLAELIERIMDSPAEAEALGAFGRQRAQLHFSEAAVLERIRAL